jgi:hypothetical protein
MIYLYNVKGDCKEYGQVSGIKIILEYIGEDDNGNRMNVYVACPSAGYAADWANSNEYYDTDNRCRRLRVFNLFKPIKWSMRTSITVDWSKDYHLYTDKDKVIVDTTTNKQ